MRVVRGRGKTPEADREITSELVEETAASTEPAVRVWTPHRSVAFGRRDANRDGYERAKTIAREHDFHVVERSVGGHAVAFTGNTVAFLRAEPVEETRTDIEGRYEALETTLEAGLESLGVDVERGEPDGAFCPGCHSLSVRGKIAGLAQRVKRDVAVVSGVLVVRDHDAIADILEPIYSALDIEFDPDAIGSVARAGSPSDPETVIRALETALSDENARIEQVREA